MKAIESEFQQAKQGDSARAAQLLWHLCDEQHPYHRFGWGDQRSLVEQPEAAGIDVRAQLVRFHKERYSANLMTAVVLGQEPLDTLQAPPTRRPPATAANGHLQTPPPPSPPPPPPLLFALRVAGLGGRGVGRRP